MGGNLGIMSDETISEFTIRRYDRLTAAQQEQALPPAHPGGDRPPAEERPRQRTGLNNNDRLRLQRMQQLEREIEATEARIGTLERVLENPPADPGEVVRLGQEYQRLQAELDERLSAWGELAEA